MKIGKQKDCDRCGFTFLKKELVRVKGLYICKKCLDKDEKE